VVSDEEETGGETGDEMGVSEESEEEDTGGENERHGSRVTGDLVSRDKVDALMTPADVEPLDSKINASDEPKFAIPSENEEARQESTAYGRADSVWHLGSDRRQT
jgi:hypothetical protein